MTVCILEKRYSLNSSYKYLNFKRKKPSRGTPKRISLNFTKRASRPHKETNPFCIAAACGLFLQDLFAEMSVHILIQVIQIYGVSFMLPVGTAVVILEFRVHIRKRIFIAKD